jgi:hypothetical protein
MPNWLRMPSMQKALRKQTSGTCATTNTTTTPHPRTHAHGIWHAPITHALMTHTQTHPHDTRTHTHRHTQLHARAHTHTHAHILAALTRSLHRPGCCLQSCTVVESADARMDTGIERSPQSATALLFAQQTNNCSKLCPMDVAVTSVRRSDRMHRFADSGQACPARLSTCPLFGCAGHS